MLKDRIISAIVIIALVVGGVIVVSPLSLLTILCVIAVVGFWEWAQFMGVKQNMGRLIIALAVAGVLVFAMAAIYPSMQNGSLSHQIIPFLMMSALWWLIAFALVINYPRSALWWKKSVVAKFTMGFLTLIPFIFALLTLRLHNYHVNHMQGVYLVFYVIALVASADSGAYAFGKMWGKNKLAPKLSPKKSIEGMVGGLVSAAVVILVGLVFFSSIFDDGMNLLAIALLSMITVLFSILGDLSESMLKREANIKDSSQLIPGHGGVLDRIDSLSAAVPTFTLGYLWLLL